MSEENGESHFRHEIACKPTGGNYQKINLPSLPLTRLWEGTWKISFLLKGPGPFQVRTARANGRNPGVQPPLKEWHRPNLDDDNTWANNGGYTNFPTLVWQQTTLCPLQLPGKPANKQTIIIFYGAP